MSAPATARETQIIVLGLQERVEQLEEHVKELQRRANGAGSFPGTAPGVPTQGRPIDERLRARVAQQQANARAHWLDYVRFGKACASCGDQIPKGIAHVWYVPADAVSDGYATQTARLYHEACAPAEAA